MFGITRRLQSEHSRKALEESCSWANNKYLQEKRIDFPQTCVSNSWYFLCSSQGQCRGDSVGQCWFTVTEDLILLCCNLGFKGNEDSCWASDIDFQRLCHVSKSEMKLLPIFLFQGLYLHFSSLSGAKLNNALVYGCDHLCYWKNSP